MSPKRLSSLLTLEAEDNPERRLLRPGLVAWRLACDNQLFAGQQGQTLTAL